MSHSISSKIRDFFSTHNENMAYVNSGHSSGNNISAQETTQWWVNPLDYSKDEDHLRWDEYGNPYIAD